MKTELDTLIEAAFNSEGATADVNKVYLTLLKTELWVPVELHPNAPNDAEAYTPLFSVEDDFIFMAAFDCVEKFQLWAGEEFSNIDYVTLKGRDVIAGIGDKVFLALNPGYLYYKEFSPEEIQRLKMIVNKIDSFSNS